MSSLTDSYLDRLSFDAKRASMLRALGAYQGKQQLFAQQIPDVLDSLKTVAIIESSESSNRLERITAPRERINAIVLKDAQPRDRDEAEIAGYRDALQILHEDYEHMRFSENIVREIHDRLYRLQARSGGRYKGAPNDIVELDSEGRIARVRFRTVSPVETPQMMADLVRLYHRAVEVEGTEPLVVVPLAILDLLCIHPFPDGNGRTARLLTLLLLYHHGYTVGRYISLERVFEETREGYYDSLEASSQGWHQARHDPYPWLTYFWGALLRAYREFEERVGEVRGDHGSKTDRIRAAVARKRRSFAISELELELPTVSRPMIRKVLRDLKAEGRVELLGMGPGARWRRIGEEAPAPPRPLFESSEREGEEG